MCKQVHCDSPKMDVQNSLLGKECSCYDVRDEREAISTAMMKHCSLTIP